jgi:RNA polymerase sigma factor (sigma-70 family)
MSMTEAAASLNELPPLSELRAGGQRQRQAIGQLYDKLAGRLARWFRMQGLDKAEADDLTQDTFVKIVRSLGSFRGEQVQLAGWIWVIARNLLTDSRRAKGYRTMLDIDDATVGAQLPPDDAPAALTAIAAERRDDCVQRGFAAFALREPERAQCLSWLVTDTMDISAIAEMLGRTPGATREYLSQCRKKLRPFVEPCLELAED